MVAVAPHGAPPSEDPIDRLRDAYGEPADSSLERRGIAGLDDEVQMVALHAEVQDAEARGARRAQRVLDRNEDPMGSEGGNGGCRPQGHVRRAMSLVRDPAAVRDRAAPGSGLAPGAASSTAPGADRKIELPCVPRHLITADITTC